MALDSWRGSGAVYADSTAWMFWCINGYWTNAGSAQEQLIDVKVKGGNRAGDVIGVEVNVSAKTLQFYVNDAAAGPTISLPLQTEQLAHLAPAVEIYHTNDSVEFV